MKSEQIAQCIKQDEIYHSITPPPVEFGNSIAGEVPPEIHLGYLSDDIRAERFYGTSRLIIHLASGEDAADLCGRYTGDACPWM